MAELPIAPGQIYIEVEYDYEYKSKDRLIRIRQGDRYMLVKKTNEDWWQVKKEEGAKAFYVPAQYVREVRKALMPPPKPILHPPPASSNPPPQIGGALWVKPTNLEVGVRDRSPENLQRKDSNCRRSPSAQTASSGHLSPSSQRRNTNNHHTPSSPTDYDRSLPDILVQGGGHQLTHKSSTLPRTRARSPEISSRAPLDVDSTQHCDSAGEERRTNDSESGDELSSSSTEHLQTVSSSGQGHSDSPIYTNLQELKITQASLPPQPSGSPINVLGDWETYKDQNGRHFYYNRSTQERTWKPPRAKDSSTGNSRGESHSAGESCEPSEKCGIVNMTKITENGKKLRKNWTSCWTVLQGSNLLFTKGQSAGTSWFGNQSKPEFTVDLKGGSADWASKDKSSKKNVIEVKTRQGTELLIQSESDSLISEWHRALQDVISTHAWESDEAIEEDMPESPGVEKHDKEKEHKDSKKGRAIKPSTSMDASDHKKTKHKLKKFLSGRPTLQSIRDKGYIKDLVFGCSLSSLCQRENSTVPAFVKMCIDHVENSGLRVDGLYRVSGNLAIIQKLRYAVNHDEKVNLADPKWEDIHVTTGALKMYFRELPEPLFTYALFHDFINAIKMLDLKQRAQGIKELVKQLPKPNHDTMQTLFKHLRKVIYHGEENRMTTQSVAIVFGPTLLRPEIETWNMAVHMVYQNQIVELILLEYESIFGR
ncbi:rho GTPase-activating protein 12-like isoform X15 [Channa argus]|uniref:rho GTPase-activating protein 12-like isoform X15 n=1 Tax=Channa argus TaxID=215402 RepID=UPI003522C0EE